MTEAANKTGRLLARRGLFRAFFALCLAGVVAIGAAWVWYTDWQSTPVYVGEQALVFEVPKGASMARVAQSLAEATSYPYPKVLTWFARHHKLANKVRAGEYAIPSEATPREFLDVLVEGKVVSYPLTIIEGWTFAQMFEAVAAHDALTHTLESADQVMSALDLADMHPEGRFYPDTYQVTRGQSDIDVFAQAYAKMEQELSDAWEARADNLPLKSPYEALILASIIERETGVADERAQIAGVFTRRLQKGMRLQTDPTVIYGVGSAYRGDITRKHLRTDTPYNTYTRHGLTPTPIALPGRGALQAAVAPENGDTLYFVATGLGDGRHQFSATLAEHNRAVAEYLKRTRQ